ncbi:cysteine proteinase [Delitschia confertaspora ATCC 74209]|uniref:ubiquitinyl hydrolase 1 n=1 Tax=Delitschia confertaspora ATCC 74209 TaxID=1513339 RepID=A0A9P4JXY6_9PLEO|nr:cysteine proteinase [Delitschia confertaspora ATCC 74209]
MDPESAAFTPRADLWRFENEMLRVQQSQAELTDRVSRLERKHDEDNRLKNVWGTSSPFPSVLGGTPQQVPIRQPNPEPFSGFDDHSSSLIGNLHLDADDEPRRVGATSRANSVRFDESANQGWAHASRSSLDLIPRTGSGLGGHLMSERSYSHRSDGRQSSAGHSVHSMTTGRANSLTSYGANTPLEPPGLAPGLFILGSVPAIIRCWLSTDFKHDTLLYAAVCSGSYASYLDMRLISRLGFQDRITENEDRHRKIKLPVYLPEAVPLTASSRSSSPTPQLPTLNVEFTIMERNSEDTDSKAIQIFLGSDMLRAHNADILFSSSQLTLYDEDRSKVQIPLVRPEDERVFKSLFVTSGSLDQFKEKPSISKTDVATPETVSSRAGSASDRDLEKSTPADTKTNGHIADDKGSSERRTIGGRPYLGLNTSRTDSKEETEGGTTSATPRSASATAIWSNWRRDTDKNSSGDWANTGKNTSSTYQRKDTGIKVLKPSKPIPRAVSGSNLSSSSSTTGHSRFFDEGRRRTSTMAGNEVGELGHKSTASSEKGTSTSGKPRSANPVGGASAFAWLNNGGVAHSKGSVVCMIWAVVPNNGAQCSPNHVLSVCSSFDSQTLRQSVVVRRRNHTSAFSSCLPACPWSFIRSTGRPSFFTTASTKKRKLVRATVLEDTSQPPLVVYEPLHETANTNSPRSSPLPPPIALKTSTSSPRYLPPHMHDEVAEASQDSASVSKENIPTAASSPSEAYAKLSLDSRETPGNMATATKQPQKGYSPDQTSPQASRPAPRSSSPAKRPASDMDDGGKEQMEVDSPATVTRRGSRHESPRAAKAASGSNLEPNSKSSLESAASGISSTGTAAELPSLGDQMDTILRLHKDPLKDGQEGYIVSQNWLARVFSRMPENLSRPELFDKSATEGEIGPIDNTNLVAAGEWPIRETSRIVLTKSKATLMKGDLPDQGGDDFVPLKPGLTMQNEFEILPTEAWDLINSWYSVKPGSPIIRRWVHNTSPEGAGEHLQYEIYPPIFTIRKLRNDSAGMTQQTLRESHQLSRRVVASRNDSCQQFLKTAKRAAGIDINTKVRVWRMLTTKPIETAQPSGMLTPDASPRDQPPSSPDLPKLLIDAAGFNALSEGADRELISIQDETANEKYNGHMNLQLAGLAEDSVLILEEQVSQGEYVSEASKKAAVKNGVQTESTTSKSDSRALQTSRSNSGRSTPSSGPVTRGRARKDGRTRGRVGLGNLGNTCYMNSALQCIRSVEELTLYFLENKYKSDLNPNNVLGYGGRIAKSYAGLVAALYDDTALSSYAPRNFKSEVSRAQPTFSGYGQQDSQEFLSFLVDALHEDLNRIRQKPYTTNPDSDDNTANDPEAIKALGEKYRENHFLRNDSVATDLFTGFYRNTMVCPDCEKVSITFDPFNLVTLQLPIEQTWQHEVIFVPRYGNIVRVNVDIDKNASFKALKQYVAKRFPGVNWNHIMAAEYYQHKLFRYYEDSQILSEQNVQKNDVVVFYELDDHPSNFPARKKRSGHRSLLHASSDEDTESPLLDKMVVPIFHRDPKGLKLSLFPSMIVLTREEARDYDSILRKVISKVAQVTTRPILTEFIGDYAPYNQSSNGSDAVLTTAEDASSNADPRIKDGSVEGEDNLVEVTMAEASESPANQPMDDSRADSSANLPDVLQPGSFIPPEFRQLFDMKYTRPADNDMLTTGWATVNPTKQYPSLQSRVRTLSPQSSAESPGANSNGSSSDEIEDVAQFSGTAVESMESGEQSSEEEIPSIEQPAFNRGGRHKQNKKEKRGKKNKHLKPHQRKNKGRHSHQITKSLSGSESDDNRMLIRLGEGIVLDWTEHGWDALFAGANADDTRGMPSDQSWGYLEDPELQEKQARRAARSKNGLTLEECFAETTKSEILSEDNAWYCGRCKAHRQATKTLAIWTTPDILVIHLKRFSGRNSRNKLNTLVDFPIEGLDLTGKVGLPEDKSLVYDLFAVDNHYGGLTGGHYTAYAQNFFDKQWYNYNDHDVSLVKDPNRVITAAAYLLFYRRRSETPLGPPYLQKIVDNAWNRYSDEVADGQGFQNNLRNPSRSPAGNDLRLGDSSRNGSSSAGTGAAVAPLRGGGSISELAESLAPRGAGVGSPIEGDDMMDETTTMDSVDQDPPPPYDEGYADDEVEEMYQDTPAYSGENPVWDFSNIGAEGTKSDDDEVWDDAASNAVDMGSRGGDDLQSRMIEDFGDDLEMRPGMSTPQDEDMPMLVEDVGDEEEDGPVAEIRIPETMGEESPGKLV